MNDTQIEYFLAVAENHSFTRTAEQLYVAQPAVSRQIASMEAELGFSLFDRTSRQTILTDAGKIFYDFYKKYKEQFAIAKANAREISNAKRGQISLGIVTGWNLSSILPPMFARFQTLFPNVTFRLMSLGFKELTQSLAAKATDAIVSFDVTLDDVPGMNIQPLTELERTLIYSSQHPKAAYPILTPRDFKDEVFFVVGDSEVPKAQEFVREYCSHYDFSPMIQTVPNTESMLDNVQNGMGVAIVDSWSRACSSPYFHTIPLDSKHNVCLAWMNSNSNPALRLFINEFTLLFRATLKDPNCSNPDEELT